VPSSTASHVDFAHPTTARQRRKNQAKIFPAHFAGVVQWQNGSFPSRFQPFQHIRFADSIGISYLPKPTGEGRFSRQIHAKYATGFHRWQTGKHYGKASCNRSY
jgi:hypothetical protein